MKGTDQKASWIVDLGSGHLVAGLVSQGPPASLHPKEYMRYISFTILLSMDNNIWKVFNIKSNYRLLLVLPIPSIFHINIKLLPHI